MAYSDCKNVHFKINFERIKLMNSKLEEYAGICPLCGSRFKFTISVYSVVNDKDNVILKCTVCGDMFAALQVKNHETFSDVEGVEIVDITNGAVSGFAICSDLVCIDRNSRGIFHDSIFAYIMNRRIRTHFLTIRTGHCIGVLVEIISRELQWILF